jgi:hypothetical protein
MEAADGDGAAGAATVGLVGTREENPTGAAAEGAVWLEKEGTATAAATILRPGKEGSATEAADGAAAALAQAWTTGGARPTRNKKLTRKTSKMEREQMMRVKIREQTTPRDEGLVMSNGQLAAREDGMEGDVELRDITEDRSKGFKALTYQRWFSQEGEEGLRFWEVLSNRTAIIRVARMIMGSHRLRIEEGRFMGLPRSERVCLVCGSNSVEDERHFLFECGAYEDLRRKYDGLFGGRTVETDKQVRQFMNPESESLSRSFWVSFAAFVGEGLSRRDDLLNTSKESQFA